MPSVFLPTPELVASACRKFDEEETLVEGALEELFKLYPENADSKQVLLKVIAVNTLYRTNIFAVMTVAEHIARNVPDIDISLRSGDPEVVEKIARIKVGSEGKERNFFSFASKYCSWHNPGAFPIYDSRVEKYLWALQKQHPFSDKFKRREDLWSYVRFRDIVSEVRNVFGLTAYSFKQIDKFMYLYGDTPFTEIPGNADANPS